MLVLPPSFVISGSVASERLPRIVRRCPVPAHKGAVDQFCYLGRRPGIRPVVYERVRINLRPVVRQARGNQVRVKPPLSVAWMIRKHDA